MQKNTLVGIIVVLLLVTAATLAMLFTPVSSPKTGINLPPQRYSEHAAYYDIDAEYATSTPLVVTAGPGADASARSLMYGFIRDTVDQFKKDGNFANLTAEDIKMMGFDQGRKETLKIAYEQKSSPNTVSYVYTVYMDTLGAHGNTTYQTFTFSTKTGAELKLADIFAPGASYLQALSSLARAKLPGVLGESAVTSDIQEGTTAEEVNFENFYFEGNSFVLLFPPYQVAAYAAGTQTLRIPRSELKNILKPEYI